MKRLINGELTESDLFLDLTLEQQNLYFHSCLYADDEGFIKNPKSICRTIGVNFSECEELIKKGFYISFTTGVIVITHWFLHNKVRKDRMKETMFLEEKSYLSKSENGIYNLFKKESDNQLSTNCQPTVCPIYNINTIYNIITITNDNINDNTNNVCSELQNSSDQQENTSEPYVIALPLNDKTMHYVTTGDYEKYISFYPAVDVMQELRNMKGWLDAHPRKLKTRSGIKTFINNWLRKDQEKKSDSFPDNQNNNSSKYNVFDEMEKGL